MKGRWFRPQTNSKEAFPIDFLPLETLGDTQVDALRLLYRRRVNGEVSRNIKSHRPRLHIDRGKENFFKRIIPILDGFDQIFKYAKDSDIQQDETLANWLKTLDTLYRRLQAALEKEGLVAVESKGQKLDLAYHEVLDTREVSGTPENLIIEEIIKGYRYGHRVLRDAKVIVAKNPHS